MFYSVLNVKLLVCFFLTRYTVRKVLADFAVYVTDDAIAKLYPLCDLKFRQI